MLTFVKSAKSGFLATHVKIVVALIAQKVQKAESVIKKLATA